MRGARMLARHPLAWLLLGSVVLLSGCSKPEVSGTVVPSESERSVLSWKRVELRLVRGTLKDDLATLAAKHRDDAAGVARMQVLADAKNEREKRAGEKADVGAAGDAPEAVRACLASAEAGIAAAKRDHGSAVRELAPRIMAVGVTATSPDAVVEQLRASVQAKIANEARRLRDEYLSTQLVQQSGTVLAAGTSLDRLCWSVHNRDDVAARFRGLTVLYNGRELPRSLAGQLWRLPPPDKALAMPGMRGVNNDLLMPGEQYEACFYASHQSVPVEVLHRYGLSTENPNRNGNWRVRWDNIELVDPTAVNGRVDLAAARAAADPLAEAFPERLHQFEAQLEEHRLIAALRTSTTARSVTQAEAALLGCHQAIERSKAARNLERVIQALDEGRVDDLAVQARVQPLLQKSLRDIARVAKWVSEAKVLVEDATIARQERDVGTTFKFADLEPGQYTLLVKPTVEGTPAKVWMIALDVQGPLTQDLVADSASDASFDKMIESVLLGANG